MSDCRIDLTKFHNRRRIHDGQPVYVVDGTTQFLRQMPGASLDPVRQMLRPILGRWAIVRRIGRGVWVHNFQLLIRKEADFVMLRLQNPAIAFEW